ncbi:MAG: ATP-binding protein [Clostridiaceae bacterium]
MIKKEKEPIFIIESKKRSEELGLDPNKPVIPMSFMSKNQLEEKKEVYKEILEVVNYFSEKTLKSLEGTPVLITISDENGYLLNVIGDETIKSTMKELGIKEGIQFTEEMGTNVVTLTLKENHPVQLVGTNHYHKFLHNSACYGVPFHYKDDNNLLGSICIMTAEILHNPFFLMTLTTVVDAIERELMLRKQNRKLNIMNQIMLSKNRSGVIVHYDGKIIFSNECAAKIIGVKNADDFYGLNVKKFFPLNIEVLEEINLSNENFKESTKVIDDAKVIRLDGNELDVEMSISYLEYEERAATMIMFNDITATKKVNNLEKKVIESEKNLSEAIEYNKRISEFFSNISHEFRTPLNVIFASIQVLESEKEIPGAYPFIKKLDRYLKSMKQNTYRLLRLVNNLIDLSKFDSGYLEPNFRNQDVVSIIENITLSVVDYVENKGIEVIFDTDIEEKIMAVDDYMIERIILNLLSNSIKFTPRGGKIEVIINSDDENVFVLVKDTGIGIPKEKIDLVFERFGQVDRTLSRNHEGSGIGLSLVKSLVKIHGGNIIVNSEEDKGTEFRVTLPAKLVDKEINENANLYENKVERINIEFSDIYDN